MTKKRKSAAGETSRSMHLLDAATVGELEFELLRRAIGRTHENIKRTKLTLAHLCDREQRQMRELAAQYCRLEAAGIQPVGTGSVSNAAGQSPAAHKETP